MTRKTCIVIGAGPGGLTAGHELLEKTAIQPVILETTGDIGGISKTVKFKGNRIDIGGHRFFSKSDRVMKWWQDIFPLQGAPSRDDMLLGRSIPRSSDPDAPDPEKTDAVLLVRKRLSRILYMRKFFNYPISPDLETINRLGWIRTLRIGLSYMNARLFPIRTEKSLEDFFINRFGRELYQTFFRDYTEKVWGIPCSKINPEWGAQRIKGLSISKALHHAIKRLTSRDTSLGQKETETSLIEQFLYPKYGPGQLWEEVADRITRKGGIIRLHHQVTEIRHDGEKILEVATKNGSDGGKTRWACDYLISTMPVKDLVQSLQPQAPDAVREVADGLGYRNFITTGLLLKKLKVANDTSIRTVNGIIPDNWIYVQESDVKLGRIQVFNNWSPYMVGDMNNIWLGLEYFCDDGDALWTLSDPEMIRLAARELSRIGFCEENDVIDGVAIRMPKTYPAYFGTYGQFDRIRNYTDAFPNLFLIGRNGMHRYNNMDHSMLTAMAAVDNIVAGVRSKSNIWEVNTEEEYHEAKPESSRGLIPR